MTREIKIGDTFFMFDSNRRVYAKDKNGRSFGAPIFREHFYPVEIFGETARSWLAWYPGSAWFHPDRAMKVPKANPFPPLYTAEDIDRADWKRNHAIRLAERVRDAASYEQLRQIAEIIGYEGTKT